MSEKVTEWLFFSGLNGKALSFRQEVKKGGIWNKSEKWNRVRGLIFPSKHSQEIAIT